MHLQILRRELNRCGSICTLAIRCLANKGSLEYGLESGLRTVDTASPARMSPSIAADTHCSAIGSNIVNQESRVR